jgi:hypothetical protein
VLCCHLGSSSKSAMTSFDAPASVPMTLSSAGTAFTLVDLLWAEFWWRFPNLKFSLTEGDIGWIPYFLQRAEHVHDRHSGWTRHPFPEGKGPSDVFFERILCCFIDDPVGIELLHRFDVDNISWESDFPHSDSTWPNGPEALERLFADVPDELVAKLTHENAMRHYHFDPFATRPREQATVAALRAEATDVDTVTRLGRKADERDAQFFRTIASRNLKAAATAP